MDGRRKPGSGTQGPVTFAALSLDAAPSLLPSQQASFLSPSSARHFPIPCRQELVLSTDTKEKGRFREARGCSHIRPGQGWFPERHTWREKEQEQEAQVEVVAPRRHGPSQQEVGQVSGRKASWLDLVQHQAQRTVPEVKSTTERLVALPVI